MNQITYEVPSGSDISEVCRAVAADAAASGAVCYFTFNGTPMTVWPGEDPQDVHQRFWIARLAEREKGEKRVSETTDVLSQAVEEIKQLRRENEILKAKVEVMNIFADAFALAHPPMQQIQMETMRVDPLWVMVKHLEELQQADKVTSRLQGLGGPGLAQAQMAKAGGQYTP